MYLHNGLAIFATIGPTNVETTTLRYIRTFYWTDAWMIINEYSIIDIQNLTPINESQQIEIIWN